MYDEEFLDSIFEPFKSLITHANFLEAIKPKDLMEEVGLNYNIDLNPFDGIGGIEASTAHQGTATWLFKPAKIRELYKKHLDK